MKHPCSITIAVMLLTLVTFGIASCGEEHEARDTTADSGDTVPDSLPIVSDTSAGKVADTTADSAEAPVEDTRSSPDLSWKFNIRENPETTFPEGNVTLVVDGTPHVVLPNVESFFTDLQPDAWNDRGVPSDALLAAESEWAGMGSVIYVGQSGNELVVQQKHVDEMGGEPGEFKPVKRIALD
jgi:hypothetical protein